MSRFLYIFISIIAAALPAVAQQNRYSATTGDVSMSSTTTFTLQAPAAGTGAGKVIQLESVTVHCSVACTITQAYNGAAATTTAATRTPIPPNTQVAATATAWSASNVGGGTAVGGITHLLAGATVTIALDKVALSGAGSAANYSVTVTQASGTANLTYFWSESQ